MYLIQQALDKSQGAQRIIRAADGEKAIELLRELAVAGSEALPELIAIDLNLPRIDGYEVLEHLGTHEIFHRIPVVVMTSSQRDADRKRALSGRADAFFVKPLDYAAYGRIPDIVAEARRTRSVKLMPANADG